MAEKKFTGAPFGTQTARFDVTGVHPNKKIPGTFTQIPYDKPSTMELNKRSKRQVLITPKAFLKMDNCLENRKFLALANNMVKSKIVPKHEHNKGVKDSAFIAQTQSPLRYSYLPKSCRKSFGKYDQQSECTDIRLNEICCRLRQSHQSPRCEKKTISGKTYPNLGHERNGLRTVSPDMFSHPNDEFKPFKNATKISYSLNRSLYLGEIKNRGKSYNLLNCSNHKRENFPKENDTDPLKTANDENDCHKICQQIKQLQYLEENNCQCNVSENHNVSNNNPTSETSLDDQRGLAEECGEHVYDNDRVNPVIDIESASEDDGEARLSELTLKLTSKKSLSLSSGKGLNIAKNIEEKTSKTSQKSIVPTFSALSFLSKKSAQAVSLATSRLNIAKVINFHTARSSLTNVPNTSKKAEQTAKVPPINAAKSEPIGRVVKTEIKPSKNEENEPASPIDKTSTGHLKVRESGSDDTTSRASMEKRLSFRQRLQGVWKGSCESILRRKLGPGAYNTSVGGFSTKTVESKASGPGWARQLEVERLASLPHLLYKEQWEENKMLKRKLGPGSYDIKDFIQVANEKPRSGRGICDNLAPRFEKAHLSATPGPGTYGIGGVPQRALEDKDIQSTSTKGMLDKGDRKRTLPSVGSHLGPGTYRHKTCTDELLNKVTSLKGPYKLYSGDRNKPITEGYLAAPQLADLGPGQYEIGSFVDDLYSKERHTHGRFGKMAQYPEVPTDRLFLFSQAHCNRRGVPGPGAYSMQELSKPTAVNSPGFLSSAKRDDKISQKFFARNFNPVGAGRYDVQKFEEAQDVNGHSSVFKSKTGKPNLQMAKFLQERIRSKDVSVENRVVLSQPCRMTRSITVM